MTFTQLLILQLIAHLLADFAFQPNSKAKEKNKHGTKSPFLKWHIIIVFLLSWFLSFQLNFVLGSAVIALTHWLIDALKKYINGSSFLGRFSFFIDQLLHIAVVVIVVSIFSKHIDSKPFINFIVSEKQLAIFSAFIFCAKPANVLIREIFWAFQIDSKPKNPKSKELPNAGKIIGIIERWLVLCFVLIGQFQAVGFLLAAKSILRYRDTDTLKTEYVLIGTMLSFGIAIIAGILIEILFS
jgi:hypothetical protein